MKTAKPLRIVFLEMLGVLALLGAAIAPPGAQAGILWVGGEPMDFPVGPATVNMTTTNNSASDNPTLPASKYKSFRDGYARGSLYVTPNYSYAYSGPIVKSDNSAPATSTSTVWLSARVYAAGATSSWNDSGSQYAVVGLVNSSNKKGLFFGYYGSVWPYTARVYRLDGSMSQLATASAASIIAPTSSTPTIKIDLQIINYGAASGTVNLYINGAANAIATFTGDLKSSSTTTLDSVAIGQYTTVNSCVDSCYPRVSEIILSDTDTRGLSLATLPPNGAGDTALAWTGGTCVGILNKTGQNTDDSTSLFSSTAGDKMQCTIGSLPAGSFSVPAVAVSGRFNKTNAGLQSVGLGLRSPSATIPDYDPTATTLGASTFQTVQKLYTTSPFTSQAWTTTEIGTLQTNVKSAQ